MKNAVSKCMFYILLPILIALSLAVAVVGEALYIPFIPLVLYLHKRNEKFRHFWDKDLDMKDSAGKVYILDFILAGSYFGLFFAIDLTGLLLGIGIPFHNGH